MLKGTYYAKITFIRCLNTVAWPQCVKTTSLQRAVSDSPSVHVTEGQGRRYGFWAPWTAFSLGPCGGPGEGGGGGARSMTGGAGQSIVNMTNTGCYYSYFLNE